MLGMNRPHTQIKPIISMTSPEREANQSRNQSRKLETGKCDVKQGRLTWEDLEEEAQTSGDTGGAYTFRMSRFRVTCL